MLLRERLDSPQGAGIAVVILAMYVIAGGDVVRQRARDATPALRRSLAYGIATGAAIACYTLWDKRAVAVLAISPIRYDFGRTTCRTLLLAPRILSSKERRDALRATWSAFRREAVGVAVLSPLAYVLVLYA